MGLRRMYDPTRSSFKSRLIPVAVLSVETSISPPVEHYMFTSFRPEPGLELTDYIVFEDGVPTSVMIRDKSQPTCL